MEEIVDATRTTLGVTDLDYLSFTAGSDPERDIWAAANQYPLTPGANRLILVRGAEKLTRWEPLEFWLTNSRKLPNTYLLFIAHELDFPYRIVDGKRTGLKAHVELIKTRGRIVRCAAPNETDAVAWVRRRAPALDDATARYLLQRTGGRLMPAAGVCAKLALFSGTVGRVTIDALADEAPAESFTDSLLALKKREALMAAQTLSEPEYPAVFGLLDSRLDTLAGLWRATRLGLSGRDIENTSPYLVRQYLPIAKHYDPKRCVYSRRVLAVCDEALKNGARVGVIEALVALW